MVVSALLCAGDPRRRCSQPRAWFALPALLIAASIGDDRAGRRQTFRYIVPLAPFLLLFFCARASRIRGAARIAVLCVLGFHLIDHALYIRAEGRPGRRWLADAREIDEVLTTG